MYSLGNRGERKKGPTNNYNIMCKQWCHHVDMQGVHYTAIQISKFVPDQLIL